MQRERNGGAKISSPNHAGEEPRTAETAPPCVDNFRPRRRIEVKSRLVDGELVILDRDRGLVHQLNSTAMCIWERCDGQHTVAEIAAQVSDIFEMDRETALRDVVQAVRQLQVAKLVNP